MIYRLEMPLIDPSLRGGQVVSWDKKVGEPIGFGEQICVVALDQFAALRRTGRATLLAGPRRGKLKSDLEVREGKVLLKMAITSSEQGVLRKILREPGDQIVIGDTLAMVESHDHTDLSQESEGDQWYVMRVAVNTLEDNPEPNSED